MSSVRIRLFPRDERKGHLRARVGVAGVPGMFEAGVWRVVSAEHAALLQKAIKQPNGSEAWEIDTTFQAPDAAPPAPPVLPVDPPANAARALQEKSGVEHPTVTAAPSDAPTEVVVPDAPAPAAPKVPRKLRGVP